MTYIGVEEEKPSVPASSQRADPRPRASIPDIARKLEIGTEIPQGVLHRPGGHWTPGALGCELQRVRDWADSSGDVDLGL